MDTCLVKLEDVYKYDVKKSYNIEINQGDFILVSGENGKGKTTLIKLILGYIKPDKGYVYAKKMNIGYLPEHIDFPLFMKVSKYLDVLCHIKKADIHDPMIYTFKIPLFKHIYELSKGNRQKLGILSACIGVPHLVILDEPLSALDQESRFQFIEVLRNLKDKKQTIMIISHYPEMIKPLCNKHFIL